MVKCRQELSLEEIANYHADVKTAIYEFFAGDSKALLNRYAYEKRDDVRIKCLAELDYTNSLLILSSVEAYIRLDYSARINNRWRDPLSKVMRTFKRRNSEPRLEDELISVWQKQYDVHKTTFGYFKDAFKYRHWLAHGRYWESKLGRKYDFITVYEIAKMSIDAMDSYNRMYSNGNKSAI